MVLAKMLQFLKTCVFVEDRNTNTNTSNNDEVCTMDNIFFLKKNNFFAFKLFA